jgi:ABC-type dipeptide/oligopeptide/nickel transport system ATPase component
MFTFLYLFYMSIYYACFIEETLSLAAAIKAGAEEAAGITRDRYIKRLTWLKSATRLSIPFQKDDRKKPVFTRISNVLENLRLDSSDGRIRKQPYCIALTGAPGCGKTGTAMKIAAALVKAKYGKFKSTDVVTLNETDEFQSEYRTNHRVVIFDDIGAENPNNTTTNPWRKIIDFVNNIRKTSLNPNLELKGNVYIQPDLVIVTTNLQPSLNLMTWVECPGAIFRRISKFYHLERFDSVYDIPRTPRSGSNSCRVYHGSDNFEVQNLEDKEHVSLDSILPSLVEEFLDFDEDQENYALNMNSLMDPPESDLSPWQSFLQDQIYPHWPKKFVLPPHIEAQLPWYQRFARKFCLPKHVAICQGTFSLTGNNTERQELDAHSSDVWSEFTPQGGEIEPQSAEEDNKKDIVTALGLPSKKEILKSVMNLSHYKELRRFMEDDVYYHIVENGFAYFKYSSENFLLASGHTYKHDGRIALPSMFFTLAEMDDWYHSLQHSEKHFIESPVFEGPINFFRSHKYDVKIDENHLLGKSMKEMLRNCQRKLPEMGAKGQLCETPSSLLIYQLLRRAWHFGYPPVAVEYNLNGLSVDGFTKIGETSVLVEAKTLMDPRDRIKRYIKDFAVDSPCIGVGINFYGYYIYYAGDVPEKDLMETAMVCSAVFRYFQKYGRYFKINIPWTKYKDHDDEFPPPKKVIG